MTRRPPRASENPSFDDCIRHADLDFPVTSGRKPADEMRDADWYDLGLLVDDLSWREIDGLLDPHVQPNGQLHSPVIPGGPDRHFLRWIEPKAGGFATIFALKDYGAKNVAGGTIYFWVHALEPDGTGEWVQIRAMPEEERAPLWGHCSRMAMASLFLIHDPEMNHAENVEIIESDHRSSLPARLRKPGGRTIRTISWTKTRKQYVGERGAHQGGTHARPGEHRWVIL